MNTRDGYLWAVQLRPVSDQTGQSDTIVATPAKDHARARAAECAGLLNDIVWEGWIKHGRTALRRVIHKPNKVL